MSLVAACTEPAIDELDIDDAAEGGAAKADAEDGTYTYYLVSADLRHCGDGPLGPGPGCGGIFYRLANASTTTCADGTKTERCYAASADWAALGLGEAGAARVEEALSAGGERVLVRATIGRRDWDGYGIQPQLDPTEAWIAQGSNDAAGPLMKIEDTELRCDTSPCPPLLEKKLNSSVTVAIDALDWDEAGATEAQVEEGRAAVPRRALIVAGHRTTLSSGGKVRTVSQFYVRASASTVPKQCYVGGCSGEVCSDQPDVISTCEWQPEYACYRDASCEVQADGECGWTRTSELDTCIGNQ